MPSRIGLTIAWLLTNVVGCTQPARQGDQQPLLVVVSGDTAGWIVPCGCTSNQSGGLLRRGTYLAQLRQSEEVVYVDAGGTAAGTSPYERAKFEAILRGELALGIVAHNVGAAEARLGAEYLNTLQRTLQVPWVTCNVRDTEGTLLGQPVQTVRTTRGTMAVVGVLSDTTKYDGIRIDPPRESIVQALTAADPRPDCLIVLAYLPTSELEALAKSLPEADVIVGGPTGQSIPPRSVGPTLLASATNKGKYVAQLQTAPNGSAARWQGTVVEMTDKFADDARQRENLNQFYATLRARDFSASETSFAMQLSLPDDFLVAGTESCRACHGDDGRAWDESPHAQAWQTLADTGAEVDPYCQQCHVTSYGTPGGFVSARRSLDRLAVGCECCHGAAAAHVKDPQIHTTFFGRARDQCQRCHDPENSPQFSYEKYWPQIIHGVRKGQPPPTDGAPRSSGA